MSTTLQIRSPSGAREAIDMGSTSAKAAIAAAEGILRVFPEAYVQVFYNGRTVFFGGKHPPITIRLP